MYCSSFSAFAACTCNFPVNFLRNQDEILDWTTPAFKCKQKKGKHGKCSIGVHSGNYSTWYTKRIWKLQYEFSEATINCFT